MKKFLILLFRFCLAARPWPVQVHNTSAADNDDSLFSSTNVSAFSIDNAKNDNDAAIISGHEIKNSSETENRQVFGERNGTVEFEECA